MKRYALPTLIIILLLTSLACQITINAPKLPKGDVLDQPETLNINEPAPSVSGSQLEVSMGAGKLNITGGGQGLVTGTVRYNVAQLKPSISRNGNLVTIDQDETDSIVGLGTDLINEWNLALGIPPMGLKVNAGAYEGTLALGGIPLTSLEINDGASKSEVTFDTANPQTMDKLSYKTGASQVEMTGLANANFREMTFDSGAGSYTLDFGGELKQDASVRITSGVSDFKVIIPANMRARIEVDGALNNVTQRGTWTVTNRVYETGGSGPLLTIEVEMSVGQLELVHQ
ncbi:MAG TPA: toast rack family protein [Anaerolineaceae bacterium]